MQKSERCTLLYSNVQDESSLSCRSRLTSTNGVRTMIRLLDRTEEWVINDSENLKEEAFTIS